MSSLTGQQIKDTYQSLLKTDDNGLITNAFKGITDGSGSASGLYLKNDGVLLSGSVVISGSLLYSGSTINATVTSASYALTASYALNGGGGNIDTSSFATTGSNTFIGEQIISGSISFGDGSLIQSISASSGDGGGYTTLTLKPNTSYASDQYIVLDPTTPNHIHIRAGGAIDSSSAYLYLGGEKANVVVRNLDNSFNEKYWVQINSQTGSTQNTWVFDADGKLTMPGSLEQGSGVIATGSYSHAEGYQTIASGSHSHAEGYFTQATGPGAHAEGVNTQATNEGSHAEGTDTQALGSSSHAEGNQTIAYGNGSHAEGYQTQAVNQYSHAEGSSTVASGSYSHAEGDNTQAIGYASHAEGLTTQAVGSYSHAEGDATKTGTQNAYSASVVNGVVTLSGSYGNMAGNFVTDNRLYLYDEPFDGIYGRTTFIISRSYFDSNNTIVELYDTGISTNTAYVGDLGQGVANWIGDQTIPAVGGHTEGYVTQAIGSYSHAEGKQTTAIGIASHAEGDLTQAIGSYSHAEGYFTQAIGTGSHAEGSFTAAFGSYSHAEGYLTQAIGDYSHAEGAETQAIGLSSHAEGNQTIASGSGQHVSGQYNEHNNTGSLFVVGIGTGEDTRKDGFTVDVDTNGSGSVMIPHNLDAPSVAKTGSMYVDPANNKLWIYTGNGGIGGWVTASLG